MNTNEKLKKASLEAEKEAFFDLPDDENIEWTPSERFEANIAKITVGKTKGLNIKRRIAVIVAAALFAVSLTVCIPLITNGPEGSVSSESSVPDGVTVSTPYNGFHNNTVSDIEINAQPEYIPEGFIINSCTVWQDGSIKIEYINGDNAILFQSYPAEEVDISAFEEIIKDIDINGNEGFAANNFNNQYNNNIAWNDGKYSYIITNSEGVELEELIKVALSVDTDK
jgi:hypothetical protein